MSTSTRTSPLARRAELLGCLLGLLVSLGCLVVAPSALPAGYSWQLHTTSEAAAQGLAGAWVARLGFLTFGLSVLLLAVRSTVGWRPPVASAHAVFGVSMCAAAAFSHQPWLPGVRDDPVEDLLHSIAASLMGVAFVVGVLLAFAARHPERGPRGALDLLAAGCATVIPIAMVAVPQSAGLLQRGMFAVAYGWYGAEVVAALRRAGVQPRRTAPTRDVLLAQEKECSSAGKDPPTTSSA